MTERESIARRIDAEVQRQISANGVAHPRALDFGALADAVIGAAAAPIRVKHCHGAEGVQLLERPLYRVVEIAGQAQVWGKSQCAVLP